MKLKFKFILAFAFIVFVSCNNSSPTLAENTDSSAGQSSNSSKDTMGNMNEHGKMTNMNMDNRLMSAMNSTMSKMQSMSMTGDFDIDFANMMIEHHQGGIDMAQAEISQGKDEKMKSKAQEILTKQKDEQQKLRDIVKDLKPSNMKMGEGELQKSMSKGMEQMKSMKTTGDIDKDFATMMTHHHEHGIEMSRMELTNGMSDKLKKIAQKSIDDQQKDINELKALLNAKKS